MKKKRNYVKVGKEKVRVKFGFPDKWEFILLGLAIGFFLWANELQNKFLDLGLEYRVTVFSGFTILAISLFWFVIAFYHFFFFGTIIRSVISHKHRTTHHYVDFMFGFIGFLGIFFLIGGAISGIYFEPNEILPYFFDFTQINAYHLGIALQVLALLGFLSTN